MQRRSLTLTANAVVSLLLFSALGFATLASPVGAADARSAGVADKAMAWLRAQQQPDGSFELAGYGDFETRDAVLAIADAAQTDLVYRPGNAMAAVRSMTRGGHDTLHVLDDVADGKIDAGKAAHLVIVATALGLDPKAFDPDGDGARDLLAVIDGARAGDGSYGPAGFLNRTIEVMRALPTVGRSAGIETASFLVAHQQANGAWAFNGDDGTNTDADVDTTARAIQALIAAGVSPTDPSVESALRWLAAQRGADGAWTSFGSPDPNATAFAMLAVVAAGYDPDSPCFRDQFDRARAGTAFAGSSSWLRSQQAADGRVTSPNDTYGVNTFATTQAMQGLLARTQPTVRATRQPCPADHYRVVAADGGWWGYGRPGTSATVPALNAPIVAAASMPNDAGHWLFAADGGVFAFGTAWFHGSAGNVRLNKPIVGGDATRTGGGYWLVASDGGIFNYGDAPFLGSLGGQVLNKPIVAMTATPTGMGYWLVASDGGVFAFGDAKFHGSLGAMSLNKPIVGAAATHTGLGYWLFASDGGVFTFGDAAFKGSAASLRLASPIVGGTSTPGMGYWLVGADGGVFTFGDAPFFGSPTGKPTAPVVGIAS